VVAVLFNTGAQVPEIPLLDVVGKAVNGAPAQIGATAVNVGVIFELMVIVSVVVVAHVPAVGVNVYVVVAVLFKAGAQVPVMPLLEVVGSADRVSPSQIGGTALNVGVILELTVMINVVVVAHKPAVGVNVYVVVAVLFKAGDQAPVIPLLEVVGSADKVPPSQIGATALNVGVIFGLTVMTNAVVVAHKPAVGVNVYVVVAVLLRAGVQEPVIPLLEVVGSADKVSPEQIGATAANVGVIFGLTVTVYVAVVAHWPIPGVNVYVPLAVLLTTAGLQVPVMPFDDRAGKVTTGSPSQIVMPEPIGKVGVIFGFTVRVNVVPATHPAEVAVKTYVPD
jgi:hypothetical protein